MNYEVIVPDQFESEFKKFVSKLDKASKAKMAKEINMLEKHGPNLGMPYSKRLNKQLWELRTGGQQRVRILYCVGEVTICLVNWFVKKSKKLPAREFEKAIKRLTNIYHR